MIQTRAVSLKKVEDVPDGKQAQNKRCKSSDVLLRAVYGESEYR